MRFEVRELASIAGFPAEQGVYAVDPRQGNDAALLAVFDNVESARELASFFNWQYDLYLHSAPMPATFRQEQEQPATQKSGESCEWRGVDGRF